jgi:NTE family protein
VTRVGLVLGSGGLAGTAFHAGVITALHEAIGWDARTASVVVGTSAGSTSAALLRAGFPPQDFLPRMTGEPLSRPGQQIMRGMPTSSSMGSSRPAQSAGGSRLRPAAPRMLVQAARRPWTVRPGSVASALLPAGRESTGDLRAGFAGLFQQWPTDDLWICTVRLSDGRRVVFGRDHVGHRSATVAEAVGASCAIPGYYEPVTIAGERYVDGGMHSLCNADLVADQGLDVVVVSAPMSTSDRLRLSLDQAWRTAARAQLAVEVRRVARTGTPVLVVHPTPADRDVMSGAALDARRRPAIARAAHASALALLSHTRGPAVEALAQAA